MLKEILRIVLKRLTQGIVITCFTPFVFIIWIILRLKFFLEEAHKDKIIEEKKELIEFWRETWEINSIDCLNWNQLKLYSQIKKGYRKNKLIKVTSDMRGIGKTTMLIKFAAKENIPIAVPFHSWKVNIEYYCKENFNKHVNVITLNDMNMVRGRRFKRVLFEEGFKEQDLIDILNHIEPYADHYTGYIQ